MVFKMVVWGGLVLAAANFVALPASALDVKPGLWDVTGTVERDGRTASRPAQSRCISAREVQGARGDGAFIAELGGLSALKARLGEDACTLAEAQNSPRLLNWRLVCKGKVIVQQVGAVRSENSEQFELDVTTRITNGERWLTSRVTAEGRYMGECPR